MHKSAKRGQESAMQRAQSMRDKAVLAAMKRKEEYLGARVPRELKEQVIARAAELDIPVSILIRRVLEDAFSAPGLGERKTAEPTAADAYGHVIGWKSVEMNRDHRCQGCGREILAGETAAFGITAENDNLVILCQACKGRA